LFTSCHDLQLREDIQRHKRAAETAQLASDAKDQQLDHWKARVVRANEPCKSSESSAQNVADEGLSATADSHPSVSTDMRDNRASGAVTDIVSKWRSVSLKQIHETHSLAEQLTVERKAVHSLRSQALMLERQLETSEDQLENERASAAARESTIRTQLANLEAQVAEQEGLLKLRSSSLAAATAHAESLSAELLGAKGRVQALEDMVKATETELQSAIHQISEMQSVVMETDVKLCDAQSVSSDRDAAIQELTSCLAAVHRIMRKPVSPNLLMDDEQPAVHVAKQLSLLLAVVEQDCSRRQAGVEKLAAQCQALEEQVETKNISAQDVRGKLKDVTEELERRTAELVQV
jgi:chromosome segregation ATPase